MGPLILLQELFKLMNPSTLFEVFWATLLGITVGMMPGLTATMGIALLTGLTFQWATGDAIREIRLGGVLHPGADDRDELSNQEKVKVA